MILFAAISYYMIGKISVNMLQCPETLIIQYRCVTHRICSVQPHEDNKIREVDTF